VTRTWLVLRREWAELKQNRFLVLSTVALPIVLCGVSVAVAVATARAEVQADEVRSLMGQVPAHYSPRQALLMVLFKQLLGIFLAVPAIIPALISAYSVIGEKQLRTLEPVLATPIRVWELLAGKALAALLPALAATWFAFGCTILLLHGLLPPEGRAIAPPNAEWALAVFAVSPLIAFGSNTLTVLVSARARDPRAAHQFSSLIVLPILGVVLAQLARGILLGPGFWAGVAAALVVVDAILLALASRWFKREAILASFG
jgi:ABC-type Na+ efflux pump permease subunit